MKAKELKVKETDDYCMGGLLFAEGLSFFGEMLSEERKEFLLNNLVAGDKKEGVKHGSAMLLGLTHAFSNN